MRKTKEQIKKELASEYYGEEAEKYDSKRVEDIRHASVVAKQVEITKEFLNFNYKNILDVACGTGRFFYLYNGKVHGIDISTDMLKVNKRKNKKAILQRADASKIPFRNNFFDVVNTSQFIKHTPEYKQVIKEMVRVTKHGGIIIIDFPNRYSITCVMTKLRVLIGRLRHYNFFSLDDIKKIAKENNLDIIDIQPTVVISPLYFPKRKVNFVMRFNKFLTKIFPELTYVFYVKFRKRK
jgi:ubiquinone/menaquinone biosynthesis C-methylase UbiE